MFCPNCGAKREAGEKFCQYCENAFAEAGSYQPAPAVPVIPAPAPAMPQSQMPPAAPQAAFQAMPYPGAGAQQIPFPYNAPLPYGPMYPAQSPFPGYSPQAPVPPVIPYPPYPGAFPPPATDPMWQATAVPYPGLPGAEFAPGYMPTPYPMPYGMSSPWSLPPAPHIGWEPEPTQGKTGTRLVPIAIMGVLVCVGLALFFLI